MPGIESRSFDQPDGIVTGQVCRWSGMAASGSCGRTINLPFLEGTVPPLDNVQLRGCLDLVQYVSQSMPDRPKNWITAANTWSNRLVSGQVGARGDPANYQGDLRVQFAITPLYGESGLPSVCAMRR